MPWGYARESEQSGRAVWVDRLVENFWLTRVRDTPRDTRARAIGCIWMLWLGFNRRNIPTNSRQTPPKVAR